MHAKLVIHVQCVSGGPWCNTLLAAEELAKTLCGTEPGIFHGARKCTDHCCVVYHMPRTYWIIQLDYMARIEAYNTGLIKPKVYVQLDLWYDDPAVLKQVLELLPPRALVESVRVK